jgi:hypothetical protein
VLALVLCLANPRVFQWHQSTVFGDNFKPENNGNTLTAAASGILFYKGAMMKKGLLDQIRSVADSGHELQESMTDEEPIADFPTGSSTAAGNMVESTVSLESGHLGALAGHRHRVVISTDIGGSDPDDFQSMVHLLLYADVLDIEGLISSPDGQGHKEDILRVIDCYENDYVNLMTYSDRYPTPDELRAITRQGETRTEPCTGVRGTTEGSDWIVQCARRDDPRPLYVLGWGSLEDVAQALHDAPDILPKLRVHWVGGPNKKWCPEIYQYVVENYPELWIIESNATYRGWFVGGNQKGQWGNSAFVAEHIARHGAMGEFFNGLLNGTMKMGDTPTVAWLLKGTPEDPSQPGWGGRFVRAWERPYVKYARLTTAEDRMEHFGIMDLVLPLGPDAPQKPEVWMVVENQRLFGLPDGKGNLRFRFCSRDAKVFSYTIHGNVPSLDGKSGQITSVSPDPSLALNPSSRYPNWWTDDPSLELAEGVHVGAKTVSQWREEYLADFAARMDRCKAPAFGK